MMRIALFLITNLAVVLLASVTLRLLGFDGYMEANGINYTALLIFCFIIGMAGSVISLFLSKTMAKSSTGTVIIEQPQNDTERWLLDTVGELARDAGIKMPEVGIFPAQQSNAFATGWNRNDALVAVSAGLLNRMRPEEVRAVLAHEIGHVANGDMVTLTLIQGVVNTFVIFLSRIAGLLFDRLILRIERGYGPGFWIVSLIMEMVLGVLAMAIVMWFSRWREYRADAGGAALAGRRNMIAALERLRQAQNAPPLPEEMRAFAISAGRVQALFASHPPLEKRIAALRQGV